MNQRLPYVIRRIKLNPVIHYVATKAERFIEDNDQIMLIATSNGVALESMLAIKNWDVKKLTDGQNNTFYPRAVFRQL